MKTIKELKAEAKLYKGKEAIGWVNGYYLALKDVLEVIDELKDYKVDYTTSRRRSMQHMLEELKKRITG